MPPATAAARGAGEDVIWSPAWREHLCLICRAAATDAEFRMTLDQKQALDARAREAS